MNCWAVKLPVTVKLPVIVVSVLTLSPWVALIVAFVPPSTILFNSSPVTPLAGILDNPEPFPLNRPLKDPENEPVKLDVEPETVTTVPAKLASYIFINNQFIINIPIIDYENI